MKDNGIGAASFTRLIARAVKSIPKGRVATYGQVARIAGNPRASRLVVWTLRALSGKHDLPWHRVINSQGRISLKGDGYELQKKMLESEGVRFSDQDRVDMNLYQWKT
jgi:methylated-DNA-protein-cysteine methyltransferase-like protein